MPLLPAAFPSRTCSAEKGMSQRKRTGSASPWDSAIRALVWPAEEEEEAARGGGEGKKDAFKPMTRFVHVRRTCTAFTIFFFSLLFSL